MPTRNEPLQPADAGPVERPVRPAAGARRWVHKSDLSLPCCAAFGSQPEAGSSWYVPLYDQAALDAAVAAERERCANVVRYWLTGYTIKDGTYQARCVQHLLDGSPAPEGPNVL